MGKYQPLGDFLRSHGKSHLPMTFSEIEKAAGVSLPPSAFDQRAWWSNNPSNNVMTRVWLDAGYETEQVDMAGRKLVFRRVAHSVPASGGGSTAASGARSHPLRGAMKGFLQIIPGTDPTLPAEPDWGDEA